MTAFDVPLSAIRLPDAYPASAGVSRREAPAPTENPVALPKPLNELALARPPDSQTSAPGGITGKWYRTPTSRSPAVVPPTD